MKFYSFSLLFKLPFFCNVNCGLYMFSTWVLLFLAIRLCLQLIILPAFQNVHFSMATEMQMKYSGVTAGKKVEENLDMTHLKNLLFGD